MVPLAFALTGGIACGKSMAEQAFRACGCRVLDVDETVRALESPGGRAVAPIAAAFGAAAVTPEGAVDRKALGALVFADAAARARLEGIVLPMAREETTAWRAAARPGEISIFSAATLFEQGWDRGWDGTVCVLASRETQIRRMMEARGMTRAEAEARLAAQLPAEEKARRATWILQNDTDDPAALQAQVDALVAQWKTAFERQ